MSFFQSLFDSLPPLDSIPRAANAPKGRQAPWPVWRDSTSEPVKSAPLSKREAARLYHEARRFERQTRRPGRQDGMIGRNGLAVLHALLFDFLNFKTGRLDPSQATLAAAANVSVSSVKRGLKALKAAGLVNWVRRCAAIIVDGCLQLHQQSNAYAILPPSQWKGYAAPPEPPPPAAEAWGACPALPDPLTAACAATSAAAMVRALEADPSDRLAMALAGLGRSILGSSR